MANVNRFEVTQDKRMLIIESLRAGKKLPEIAKLLETSTRTLRRHFDKEIKQYGQGTKQYKTNAKDRKIAIALKSMGENLRNIASCLGIDVKTLRAHYADDLAQARGATDAKIFNSLVAMATGRKPNLKAIELYLKCQAGWMEEEKRVAKGPEVPMGKKEREKARAQEAEKSSVFQPRPVPPGLKVVK